MSVTRPISMSKEDVDKLVRAIEECGGSITLQDPRVSRATSWIIAGAATTAMGLVGWLATSVNELSGGLKENTAELRAYNRRLDEFRSDYQADRAEIRARLAELERKK